MHARRRTRQHPDTVKPDHTKNLITCQCATDGPHEAVDEDNVEEVVQIFDLGLERLDSLKFGRVVAREERVQLPEAAARQVLDARATDLVQPFLQVVYGGLEEIGAVRHQSCA